MTTHLYVINTLVKSNTATIMANPLLTHTNTTLLNNTTLLTQ